MVHGDEQPFGDREGDLKISHADASGRPSMGGSDGHEGLHGRLDRLCGDRHAGRRFHRFLPGLDRLLEDDYFVVTPAGFLAVDLTTWGWVMPIWWCATRARRLRADRRSGVGTLVRIRGRVYERRRQLGFLGNGQSCCGR